MGYYDIHTVIVFVIGNTIRKAVVTVMIGNYIHRVIVIEGSLFSREYGIIESGDGNCKNCTPLKKDMVKDYIATFESV